MSLTVTPPPSISGPEFSSAPAEESAASEIAGMADTLGRGRLTTVTLEEFLDDLEGKLDDPKYAARLEAGGITKEQIDELRDGLKDPSSFNSQLWLNMFGRLDNASEQGTFSVGTMARFEFADYAVRVAADKMDAFYHDAEQMTKISEFNDSLQQLVEDSDGPVELSVDMVAALMELGLEPADVSNSKLREILETGNADGVTFKASELEDISEELATLGLTKGGEMEQGLLLELKSLEHMRQETARFINNIDRAVTDAQKQAAERVGSS